MEPLLSLKFALYSNPMMSLVLIFLFAFYHQFDIYNTSQSQWKVPGYKANHHLSCLTQCMCHVSDYVTPWEKARDRAWKSPIFKSCLWISHHYFHVHWTQFPISWNAPRPELAVWFLFLLDLTRKIPRMFPLFQPTGTF